MQKFAKYPLAISSGYAKGKGYRKSLGALLIAQHRENRLMDRGNVGIGISSFLRPSLEENCVTCVDPNLRIEMTYFKETEGARFRFPVLRRIIG